MTVAPTGRAPEEEEPFVPSRRDLLASRLPTAEAVFTIVALLAGTLGPVYQIRARLGPVETAYANDPVVIAAFGGLYVIAGILGARSTRELNSAPVSFTLFLNLMLVLSTLWSISRPLTAMQSIMALSTVVLPWYLAKRWNHQQLLVLAWVAVTSGVLMSAFALVRRWNGSVDERGFWTGIYMNRNSLGPVAGLTLILSGWMLVAGRRHLYGKLGTVALMLASATLPLSALLLLRSGSKTPTFATAVALTTAFLITAARRILNDNLSRSHVWSALAIAATAFVVAFRPIATALGSSPTLEGRTRLWSYLSDRVWQRPLTGDGWMATYTSLEYWHWGVKNLSRNVDSAHNGIMEVAVGAGVIALLALVVILWMGFDHSIRELCEGLSGSVAPLVVAVFFLLANAGETFIGANHFLWVLFLALCVLPWKRDHSAASASASASAG